jgi:predicted DNA-binding transcriptional regulator AlpA
VSDIASVINIDTRHHLKLLAEFLAQLAASPQSNSPPNPVLGHTSIQPRGPPHGDVVIRIPAAVKLSGLCRSTLLMLEKTDPDFPKRIRLSVRCTGWDQVEFQRYFADRPRVRR